MAEDAAARYADLVAELAAEPGVTPPEGGSGFGRSALKFRGWLSLDPAAQVDGADLDWADLAREALAFAGFRAIGRHPSG